MFVTNFFKLSRIWRQSKLSCTIRTHYSESSGYDGDGKTTVKMLDDDNPNINIVKSYSSSGFRITNHLIIVGSIIMFPTNVYSWNVKRGVDITPESLLLFDIIVPKIKMLVLGYGTYGERYDPVIPTLLRKKGISCEILPTSQAVTTYNYLAVDGVLVAGAFVPIIKDAQVLKDNDAMDLIGTDIFMKERDHSNYEPREDMRIVKKYLNPEKKDEDKNLY